MIVMWIISFVIALVLLVGSIAFSMMVSNSQKNVIPDCLSGYKVAFFGTFMSAFVLFFPIYNGLYPMERPFNLVLLSLHNAIRLFVIDGELSFVYEHLQGLPQWLLPFYGALFGLLFFAAPAFTLGAVLSFLKNVLAGRKYRIGSFKKDVYAFSELNENSYTLAKSIKAQFPKSAVVFTEISEEDTLSDDWQHKLRLLDAICFKSDVASVNFAKHSKNSAITFFCIGDDEEKNTDNALRLIRKYGNRDNTGLYVFSAMPEAELIFSQINEMAMKVYRVNPIQSFVYEELYTNGYESIFQSAQEKNGQKKISAVIIGMDDIGFEMARSLPWLCQMDGYQVEINVFSNLPDASQKFHSVCPELVMEAHNGHFEDDGEAQYRLQIYDGVRILSDQFYERLAAVDSATYVFVSLGNDGENLKTATELRRFFERCHIHPVIKTVLTDTSKKESLLGSTNHSGQAFDIEFVGDRTSVYSYQTILKSSLTEEALLRHKKHFEEARFWRYEYNRKSSMASAIHKKLKQACGISGIMQSPEERSQQDRVAIRKLEHRRWNAYMRSEGFVYSGSTDKSSRNDLAKMHPCLVPFSQLSMTDQEKDDD